VSAPTAVVLRAIGLGDMITGLPAMALLRRALPGHRIVGAVPGRYAGILLRAGLLDEVLPTAELGPLDGAPGEPDLAVDLHGNGPPSRDLLRALGPRRLLAFVRPGDDAGPGVETSTWDDGEHEVDRWCRLLREHLDGAGEPPPLWTLLAAPPAVLPGATVLHPGAAAGSRRWPADRWAAVAAALTADGHRVVVTGTPGEQQLVESVAGSAGAETATALDLDELFGLVAAARLVVSGDTGVAHVAAAYGIPSVVLAGPVSPARWGPPDRPRHTALWPAPHPGYRGDPHARQPDPVLLRTTVSDVLAGVTAVLGEATVATRGGRGVGDLAQQLTVVFPAEL
jgi:ADP-heptose:LPS heptosyltransferase